MQNGRQAILFLSQFQDPKLMYQEASRLINARRYWEATPILEQIVSRGQAWDDVFLGLGAAYIFQNRRQDAIEALFKAIELNPKSVAAYGNLCFVLAQEYRFEEAVVYGEKGLSLDPSHLPLYTSLSYALRSLGRMDEAIRYTRRALSYKKNDIQSLANLGAYLFESGQKEQAGKTFLKVLKLQPGHANAHRLLSQIRDYKSADAHIAQMEGLLSALPQEPELRFALGNAYEKLAEYGKSFEYYKAANDLQRKTFNYSTDQYVAFFKQIKQAYTKDFIDKNKNVNQDKTPIFVIGMPRSATSLVEQILASHPDVYGAGELTYLGSIQFKDKKLDQQDYAQVIRNLGVDDFKGMADLYVERLEDVWKGHRYVVDKMPHNFRYVGLIKILFPNAKIIHCKRDPRDTCFSIFKTYFTSKIRYSCSLEEIAAFYELYKDLMSHWHTLFPEGIYDLQYEALIENPEESIRGLLGYCDLEWHEDCMAFHKTKRSVRTASALQVRKPIYKSSVGYWKNYEPYLGEIAGLEG
jgi:tetratricopeptide (TPR) repeat protein